MRAAIVNLLSKERVQSIAILSGALMGYGFAEGLGAFKALPLQHAITADNFVTFVLGFWTGALWFMTFEQRLEWTRDQRLHLKYAVSIMVTCLALHRGFWEPWWVLEGLEVLCKAEGWSVACVEFDQAAQQYSKDYILISTLAQAGWWLSMWLLLAPWYERKWGYYWPYIAVAATVGIWLIGFQITDVASLFIER